MTFQMLSKCVMTPGPDLRRWNRGGDSDRIILDDLATGVPGKHGGRKPDRRALHPAARRGRRRRQGTAHRLWGGRRHQGHPRSRLQRPGRRCHARSAGLSTASSFWTRASPRARSSPNPGRPTPPATNGSSSFARASNSTMASPSPPSTSSIPIVVSWIPRRDRRPRHRCRPSIRRASRPSTI